MSKCIAKRLIELGFRPYQLQKAKGIKGFQILHAYRPSTFSCDLSQSELERITEGIYSKLSKSYYAYQLFLKGFTKKQIADMLNTSYDGIRSMLKHMRRKESYQELKHRKKEVSRAYRQYRKKKVDIELLISTLKFKGWYRGLKVLKVYVGVSAIKDMLKRFNLSKSLIESLSYEELRRFIVNDFVMKKAGLTLDGLSDKLSDGKVTGIGILEWDRLRNTGLKKKDIVEHRDDLKAFLIEHIWRYLKYFQTECSLSRRMQIKRKKTQRENNCISDKLSGLDFSQMQKI